MISSRGMNRKEGSVGQEDVNLNTSGQFVALLVEGKIFPDFVYAREMVCCVKPEAKSGRRDIIACGSRPIPIDGRTASSGTGIRLNISAASGEGVKPHEV